MEIAPVRTGELLTTLILYPDPAGVPPGIAHAIVPEVVLVSVPIAVGDAKLPPAALAAGEIQSIELTDAQARQLVAFLKTLDGGYRIVDE